MTMGKPDDTAAPIDECTGPASRDIAAPATRPSALQETTSEPSAESKAPRPHRSIALMRLLGADCPSCRGFGCGACAGTGLG